MIVVSARRLTMYLPQKNWCFSEEPGLFDPENGCGFNWSDTVVTGAKSAYRVSRVPYSKEWCWIKL
jgi:hypothetical protein